MNGKLYFLWRLSRMSLKGKISNVSGRPFCMVMLENYFMEHFFLDGTCLGKVTSSKNELVVVVLVVRVI